MKVLIACEFSGTVREAFRSQGHDAYSCDLHPAYDGHTWGHHPNHIQSDVVQILDQGWDLLIAHPPCTHLAYSNYRYGIEAREAALQFARVLLEAPVPRIAIENPRSHIDKLMPHTQEIQPWMFGDPYVKTTWLWLKNLPRLRRDTFIEPPDVKKWQGGHYHAGFTRSMQRSVTFPGVARAMGTQWGAL